MRKVAAAFAAVVAVGALAGCGSAQSAAAPTSSPSSMSTPAPTETESIDEIWARNEARAKELAEAEGTQARTAAPQLTVDEAAYVKAQGSDSDPETVLSMAREDCQSTRDAGKAGEARARYIIESVSSAIDDAAVKYVCKDLAKDYELSKRGFNDGAYEVVSGTPKDPWTIKAGTYRSEKRISDCYWERSTSGGTTVANDFVANAPSGVTVRVRAGEGFKAEGCGTWLPTS